MKKRAVILVFILLVLAPSAIADWFYNSESITADIEISSDADVVPLTPSGYIDSASINLTFFPKQYPSQEIVNFYTNPEAELSEKNLRFTWKRPEGTINFLVNARVKTQNAMAKIDKKIK